MNHGDEDIGRAEAGVLRAMFRAHVRAALEVLIEVDVDHPWVSEEGCDRARAALEAMLNGTTDPFYL